MVTLITVLLATFSAQAHTGHHGMEGGLASGFLHPMGGWDHLLAMVAVGIWAVQMGHGRALWSLPLTFMSFMVVGLILGTSQLNVPLLEMGILASVLVFGIFIAFAYRPTTWIGYVLVAGFALFHGCAHGLEMPAHSSGWWYGIGMTLSTGLLHVGGILLGTLLALPGAQWTRVSGAAILITGVIFFLVG